jgi:hypothetical protein
MKIKNDYYLKLSILRWYVIMETEKNEYSLKNDVQELTKEIYNLTSNTEKFFNEIVSFLKWTTAFSFVIIAWFATQLKIETTYDFYFGIFGLFFIVLSIVISIITLKKIITYSEITWKAVMPLDQLRIYLIGEREPPEDFATLLEKSKPYVQQRNEWLNKFKPNLLIMIHLACLLLGLIFYSLTLFF